MDYTGNEIDTDSKYYQQSALKTLIAIKVSIMENKRDDNTIVNYVVAFTTYLLAVNTYLTNE